MLRRTAGQERERIEAMTRQRGFLGVVQWCMSYLNRPRDSSSAGGAAAIAQSMAEGGEDDVMAFDDLQV